MRVVWVRPACDLRRVPGRRDVQQLEADDSKHLLYCDHHGARVLSVAHEVEDRLPAAEIERLWEERARAEVEL